MPKKFDLNDIFLSFVIGFCVAMVIAVIISVIATR